MSYILALVSVCVQRAKLSRAALSAFWLHINATHWRSRAGREECQSESKTSTKFEAIKVVCFQVDLCDLSNSCEEKCKKSIGFKLSCVNVVGMGV